MVFFSGMKSNGGGGCTCDDEGPWDFALPLKQTIYKPLIYVPQSPPSTEEEEQVCDSYRKHAKTPRIVWFTPHPKKLIRISK